MKKKSTEHQFAPDTFINNEPGLIHEGKLNEVIVTETRRSNGSLRIQQDFSNCPTLAEQHTGHLSDINYLMEKYQPDELAAYIVARSQYRQEILGHDFTREPSMQDGLNVVYKSRKAFSELPDEIKNQFKNHVEFLKFIDNPQNAEKMTRMGLLTAPQIKDLQIPETNENLKPITRTKDETEAKT